MSGLGSDIQSLVDHFNAWLESSDDVFVPGDMAGILRRLESLKPILAGIKEMRARLDDAMVHPMLSTDPVVQSLSDRLAHIERASMGLADSLRTLYDVDLWLVSNDLLDGNE